MREEQEKMMKQLELVKGRKLNKLDILILKKKLLE